MDAVRKDVRRLVNKELEAGKQTLPSVCQPARGTKCCSERAGRSGTGDCAAETLHRNPDVECSQGKPDRAER